MAGKIKVLDKIEYEAHKNKYKQLKTLPKLQYKSRKIIREPSFEGKFEPWKGKNQDFEGF